MSQAIEIAAKLDECRATLKRLTRDKYAEKIAPWMLVVRELAKRFGCRAIQVVPRLKERRDAAGDPLDGIEILWLSAATVEVIEQGPS